MAGLAPIENRERFEEAHDLIILLLVICQPRPRKPAVRSLPSSPWNHGDFRVAEK